MVLYFLFPVTGQAIAQSPISLSDISLGSTDEYTRLVFTFNQPINDIVASRDDVDTITLNFGVIDRGNLESGPRNEMVKSVKVYQDGDRLLATIVVNTNRFESRTFLSREKLSCILDIKNLDGENSKIPLNITTVSESDTDIFRVNSLKEVVKSLSFFIISQPNEHSAEKLLQSALDDLINDRLDQGLEKLEQFKNENPNHPYGDPAFFIIGDAYLAKGLPDNFIAATSAWREALDLYPNSFDAPRAAFMIGEANRLMDYRNEAAAHFLICAEQYPDNNFGELAIIKAADMKLAMGLNDDARKILEPLLPQGLSTKIGLAAQTRLAMADYQETLFSQACERFHNVLDEEPNFYQLYPDMLYAMGDSYSYLNRPDLTVDFLDHALNVMPNHPKADVMLARIGNALQSLNRQPEAISYFNIAKDRFPDTDGGLVSQIRLADMGALKAFFRADQVFDALERGARQTTVQMYNQIIEAASESSLLQLAYLKIGQAQAADGENGEAIKWLRDMVIKYPKGVLLDEAKPILSRAVVNEAQERYNLGEYDMVDLLNSDNSSYLNGPDLLRFQRILAQSYENLGRHDDALAVWKAIEDQTPEKRLSDQKELIEAALKASKPQEAFNQLKSTLAEFPEEENWANEKIGEIGQAFTVPSDSVAVDNLLYFRDDPLVALQTDTSQKALSDAITIEINNKRYDEASRLIDTYRREYPDDDLNPEYILTQAKMERRQGRLENAWNRLSEFRIQYPDDPRVSSTIMETINDARKNNQLDDAYRYQDLYRYLYPEDPKGRSFLFNRADELWNQGLEDKAIEALKNYQSEYPNDPNTPSSYINQYHKLLSINRSDEAFDALNNLRNLYPDDPLTKETYMEQYRDALGRNEAEKAFDILAQFRKIYPDDPLTKETYLYEYHDGLNHDHSELAFNALNTFRERYPDDLRQPDLLLEQAKDYFSLGRRDEGLTAWNNFLTSFPEDSRTPELTLLEARLEYKENLVDQALGHYRLFINNYPDNLKHPEVLLEISALETSLGLTQNAFNDLATFRNLYPENSESSQAILDQIDLAKILGQISTASSLYSTFRSTYPNHPKKTDSYLDQAKMEMANGQSSIALTTLEEAIVATPGLDQNNQIQDLLLSLYLDEGRVEDWAGAMEEFLNKDPNPQQKLTERFNKYSQVAQVYQELGRQSDAERNYDLAIANRPPDASGESLYTIAGGYKKMGRDERYKNVLEIIKDLPDPLWQNVANQELGQV